MKKIMLICLAISLLGAKGLYAQKNLGKLKHKTTHTQRIEIATYHQYQINLKKGTLALLNLTAYNVHTSMTVVSPQGMVVERTNTAGMADFLVFEAPENGSYQFYIQIDEEKNFGTYTLATHYIPATKAGTFNQIKKLLQLLEKPSRAGLVAAIVKDGKIIFEYQTGYANVEHRLKNNKETVFELASVSKQFTAMAIAVLAEEGKLSVEDDIRMYFPELPIYKNPIRVKHLLNHTAGIIESGYPLDLAGFEDDPIELAQVLTFLQNTPEQYFKPGTAFSYSNDAYTLLGELVYRVTKQDFKDWMQEHIFTPLNMHSSVIRDSPEQIIPNRATSYVAYTGETHFRRLSFDFYAPGGCSVRSSINDLVKWVNYLNKGYHSQEKIFKRIHGVEQFPNGEAMEYAYGNFVTQFRGLKRFSHLGLSAGFTTAIARFPEQNLAFIVLGNDGEFKNYYLSRKIYEIYLEDQLDSFSTAFEGMETKVPIEMLEDNENTLKDVDLNAYEGNYFSQQLNATYSFQLKKDTLYALSAAYAPIPIIEGVKDTLKTDEDFMETLVFRRDYKGEVSEINIYNDSDEYGILFTKIAMPKKWSKSEYWESASYRQRMLDTLTQIEASKVLPGFAVSVFDESEIFIQKGYGYANIKEEVPYNPETIQLIASISKSITAMAVFKAMELGHFKLDDPINKYLPFKITNPKYSDIDITIRHLLTHTSSLNDNDSYNTAYVFKEPLQQKDWPKAYHESLSKYDRHEKLPLSTFLDAVFTPNGKLYNALGMYTEEKPGSNFEYSNFGFALLGYIIELTTKEDFRDFTKKHIFDPLDMTSATWDVEKIAATQHATYYLGNRNKPCPKYTCNTIPDGGLYTNIIDLTKFLQEAMRGYTGKGSILSQASYREMFRSQSDLVEIEGGLGWDLSISCCIGHGGNDFGLSTVMYFQPRTGIGRIVFSNTSIEAEEVEAAFYGVMNLLFIEEW